MVNDIPNIDWLVDCHRSWELASRILYREGTWFDFDAWEAREEGNTGTTARNPNQTPAEAELNQLWDHILNYTLRMAHPGVLPNRVEGDLPDVLVEIRAIRTAMENLRMPGSTTLQPEDEPTMFHENMLISCYTKLEALRAVYKLANLLYEIISNAKSKHPLKSKIAKDFSNDLVSETQVCYESIRDVAQSYINLIKRRGITAIKAQIRWGKTGECLSSLLDDDDVEYYAKEYVDSALEAWNGVLKVKLK